MTPISIHGATSRANYRLILLTLKRRKTGQSREDTQSLIVRSRLFALYVLIVVPYRLSTLMSQNVAPTGSQLRRRRRYGGDALQQTRREEENLGITTNQRLNSRS